MTKWKLSKLSKKTRYLSLVIIGLVLIVATAVASEFFIKTNDDVYVPNVVSNYQQNTESVNENVPEEKPENNPDDENPKWPATYSLDQADSLTVVVNKKHRLPSNYVPNLVSVAGGQIRPEAANDLKKLLDDATNAGAPMNIISSYRSYQTQVSTYQYWVDTQGQTQADRESARPGHSEHQTGLTVDMGNPDGTCRLVSCFGDGPAGKWLDDNAHKYGFIVRYPPNSEHLTGYIYEPWHIRYLGVDIATAVYNSGLTLDQYFNVEAGDY